MAYSRNQNQLRLWGPSFSGMDPAPVDQRHALTYWCRVHERLLGMFERFPGRGIMLNFYALCDDPERALLPMLRFIEIDPSMIVTRDLTPLIRAPASIGRFRTHDSSLFNPENIRFVANLGFPVGARSRSIVASAGQRSEFVQDTGNTPLEADNKVRRIGSVLCRLD